MTTLKITFTLSAPARRALGTLETPKHLEYIAERFFDKLQNERYRNFAVQPTYYTTIYGMRKAYPVDESKRELKENYPVRLTLKTFGILKKLEQRGLKFTWLMEEILYYGFLHGLLK